NKFFIKLKKPSDCLMAISSANFSNFSLSETFFSFNKNSRKYSNAVQSSSSLLEARALNCKRILAISTFPNEQASIKGVNPLENQQEIQLNEYLD
ncbi:hypothetical protein Mgra_00009029, partial [Meloidogyne graminicola]